VSVIQDSLYSFRNKQSIKLICMSILSPAARMAAVASRRRFGRWTSRAVELQDKVFRRIVEKGSKTAFGREHGFESITSYASFAERVPVRGYEELRPYIDRIMKGEKDVLWPGLPKYFAMSSGTTSGAKYIPITPDSLPNHIGSARNAFLRYIGKTGRTDFVNGKYIFLSGSPKLDESGPVPCGRLSGIAHHNVPHFLRPRRLPSYETNCIANWEEKLEKIIDETINEDMTLISGIPPWVTMYFEKLLQRTGKNNILEVFPRFSLMVHGGVNFAPYSEKLFRLIGQEIDMLETFPASEGFFAFQDEFPSGGLLLIPDSGIFYEFVPAERFGEENPPRIPLSGVEPGVNYVMIINSNAGLWGYNLGDTVKFLSVDPYRLTVTGRISQFTSAFGEHVIEEEADYAIGKASEETGAVVGEFTLAPLVDNPGGMPCHQWFVEFEKAPADIKRFAESLDKHLQHRNDYYKYLVEGKIIGPAMVIKVPRGTFNRYMDSIGKLGGQHKVPHLSNDRGIADWIIENVQPALS